VLFFNPTVKVEMYELKNKATQNIRGCMMKMHKFLFSIGIVGVDVFEENWRISSRSRLEDGEACASYRMRGLGEG